MLVEWRSSPGRPTCPLDSEQAFQERERQNNVPSTAQLTASPAQQPKCAIRNVSSFLEGHLLAELSPMELQTLGRLPLTLKSPASKQDYKTGLTKRTSLLVFKFYQKDKTGKYVFGDTTAPSFCIIFYLLHLV